MSLVRRRFASGSARTLQPATVMAAADTERTFSITRGGPWFRAFHRLYVGDQTDLKLVWSLAFAAWTPIVVGEGIRLALHMAPDRTLHDVSVHARLLIALPLLLVFEPVLDAACRGSVAILYDGKLCDSRAVDRIVRSATHMRDAWWFEAALAVLALLGGQLVLWEVVGSTGVFSGGEAVAPWSFPRVWYAVIALPLVQFLMFRWAWRWVIWSIMLMRLARLPLATLATHPDRAAGLSLLGWPLTALCGFVTAVSSVLSGAWVTQMLAHRATLEELLPGLVVFLAIAVVVGIAPLLLFSGHLFRARRLALFQYGEFTLDYIRQFHEKWILPAHRSSPLGSPDIQSLNDLGAAFQVIATTRMFVFHSKRIFDLVLAALLPMLPLLATNVTFEQAVRHVLSTVLGGLAT